MSGLNSNYVTGLELEDYFVSNQNGEALAGGEVTFYKDNNRTQKKDIFQLSYNTATGFYSYSALPNPITLSGVGTFQNSGGDNIAVYYYPLDQFGNQELYYITVYDAFGNLQFTREAWPFPNDGSGSGSGSSSSAIGLTNQLSNPQFALVNFKAASTLTITIGATPTTTTVPVAPNWYLDIVNTGAATVTVTQTPVAGSANLPFNPPYTLDFVISSNITECKLYQTLSNNPDWAAPQSSGVMGYLSGSILLGNGTSVNMKYIPSAGNAAQTILNTTNTTGAYAQSTGTVQLQEAANPQTGAVGSDQIAVYILNLPGSASISNVQVIPLTSNVSGVQYDQTPVNRQIDHLFNYYNTLLQYKPIPSWLVGWDFALNPAQLGSTQAASATGANKSKYIWDQTIMFQSTDSSVGAYRAANGTLGITMAATGQLALVQYIEGYSARNILRTRLSSMVSGFTDVVGGLGLTVSLYYTTGTSLPDLTTGLSLVATLDANGKPATFNLANGVAWTEVPRSGIASSGGTVSLLGDATCTFTGASSDYGFSGWSEISASDTATFFAIVVGTASVPNGKSVNFEAISLVPGDIPTIPAPQTQTAVINDCKRYYQKSFALDTIPANAVGLTTGEQSWSATISGANQQYSPTVQLPISMRASAVVTLYNPLNNNSQVLDETTGNTVGAYTDCSASSASNPTTDSFYITTTGNAGGLFGDFLGVHWTADARLGLV